jgi:aromatic ring-cleaving dioxygenase
MCGPLFEKGDLKKEWDAVAQKIAGYHIHIYMNDKTDSFALFALGEKIRTLFEGEVEGPFHVGKVGPHTQANIEFDVTLEAYAKVVPWLQMNSAGLSILIHPRTGDELKDHLDAAMWIGKPVRFNDRFFDQFRP